MRTGHELARSEGPLHPGTMPLYPVPTPAHANSVSVPLPIVAVDTGRRGLYAPPRVAVVRWPAAEAIGVRDAADFHPDRWPPPFLGDWPPTATRAWDTRRIAGAIERFTAIWGRLLDSWFIAEDYAEREGELREARFLLHRLVPLGLRDFYRELSPDFYRWLHASGCPPAASEDRAS